MVGFLGMDTHALVPSVGKVGRYSSPNRKDSGPARLNSRGRRDLSLTECAFSRRTWLDVGSVPARRQRMPAASGAAVSGFEYARLPAVKEVVVGGTGYVLRRGGKVGRHHGGHSWSI